ncbi:MAG: hypothetical protein KKG59_02485 [Nanoarchaeota archaeon]|nr:hypothetical protein [Nanoarchaeota archaeon]
MGIVEDAREFALSEIKEFGTPIVVHFELSEREAKKLLKEFEVDEEVVLAGVYLMDVKLGQAIKEGRPQDHVQMSVDATEEFLDKSDLEEEKRKKILNCVGAHHGTIPFECKEAEICANADCYRFIHPRGVFAYFTLLGKRSSDPDDCISQAEKKLEEKWNILSLNSCKQELEPYYKSFKQFFEDARK